MCTYVCIYLYIDNRSIDTSSGHPLVPSLPNGRPAAPFGHCTLHLKGCGGDAPEEVAGEAAPVLSQNGRNVGLTWGILGVP